jgi:hypothetical protein
MASPHGLPASPRRPYIKPSVPSALFTMFAQLPAELRLKIWDLSMAPDMSTCIVPVSWCASRRALFSPRRPPVQLHVCAESRYEALKVYQLCFAAAPACARTYFSYENDILLLNWASLKPAPGWRGRKMRDEEARQVKALMINEEALLLHAREGMRELECFGGLKDLAVLCDSDNPQSGETFGAYKIELFAASLDSEDDGEDGGEGKDGDEVVKSKLSRKHPWPDLVCLRDEQGMETCSRHWWFDSWNQRAKLHQSRPWTEAMAECLLLTNEEDAQADDTQGDEETLMDLLQFLASGHILS